MKFTYVACSALAVAVLLGGSPARAWTIDSQSGNTSDGTARFSDPDEKAEKLTDPGSRPTSGIGFSAGVRSSDSPYSSSTSLFNTQRSQPPAAAYGDDSHLYWGNSGRR